MLIYRENCVKLAVFKLTFCDPTWSLTTTNDKDHVFSMEHLYTMCEINHSYPSWDTMFTRFWPRRILTPCDPKWPLTSTKYKWSSTWYGTSTCQVCNSSVTTRFAVSHVYEQFKVDLWMTLNDLWPLPKIKGIIYSIWASHIWSTRFLTVTLLAIPFLQDWQKWWIA